MTLTLTIEEFASKYMGDIKVKPKEYIGTCPYCGKKKFNLNRENGKFQCLSLNTCGKKGNFHVLAKDYSFKVNKEYFDRQYFVEKVKEILPPEKNVKEVTENIVNYFIKRKISKKTVNHFRIGSDEYENIIFPFYHNGECVLHKYRSLKKNSKMKEWASKNGKYVLFNLDQCSIENGNFLFITEGLIDAMSVYQAGIKNVVSLPSGVNNFNFMKYNFDDIKKYEKIIFFLDNDNAGKLCQEQLTQKIGIDKCWYVNNNSDYKDANDFLVNCYKDEFENLCSDILPVLKEQLFSYGNVDDETYNKNIKRIRTGFREIDKRTGGFIVGDLTVITGYSGSGKSTFTNQLILNIINQGISTFLYSGEMLKYDLKTTLKVQASKQINLDKKYDDLLEKYIPKVLPDNNKKIDNWFNDFLYGYESKGILDIDDLLKSAKFVIDKMNVEVVIIDNLMCLTSANNSSTKETLEKEKEVITKLKTFAIDNKITLILIAHPVKNYKEEKLNQYNLLGTSVLTNLTSGIISVERLNSEVKKHLKNEYFTKFLMENRLNIDEYSSLISILKNRKHGTKAEILFTFNEFDKRFTAWNESDEEFYNWIDNKY